MRKYLISLVLVLQCVVVIAQSQIGIRGGVYAFNEEVLFPKGLISWLENDLKPSFGQELFFAKSIGKGAWFWTGNISYQRFQCVAEIPFMYTYELLGKEVPVFATASRNEFVNTAGVGVGTGYHFANKTKSQRLRLEFGGRVLTSFKNGVKIDVEEETEVDYEYYHDDDFSERILLGCFFRPSYQVKIGDTKSPWEVILFFEGNVLWRNKAPSTNPIFTYGGGLGLSYSLKGVSNFKGRGLK